MKYPVRNWCVLAVDPGTSPTICAIWDRGEEARWYDSEHTAGNYRAEAPRRPAKNKNQPSDERIRRIMEYHNPDLVVIEKVWVRPTGTRIIDGVTHRGQGVVSQARLVFSMALCEGIAAGLGLNILRLFPQTWMKHHGLITKDKGYHRSFAQQLVPKWSWAFTRSKDHDRADAYLMALTGLAFIDRAFERACAKGAPLDHRPVINTVR